MAIEHGRLSMEIERAAGGADDQGAVAAPIRQVELPVAVFDVGVLARDELVVDDEVIRLATADPQHGTSPRDQPILIRVVQAKSRFACQRESPSSRGLCGAHGSGM
jgi:hypothetical protein